MKGRVPIAGSREFGRKTRGVPVPPTRRKPAELKPLSEAERAQERIEDNRMRRDWMRRDRNSSET